MTVKRGQRWAYLGKDAKRSIHQVLWVEDDEVVTLAFHDTHEGQEAISWLGPVEDFQRQFRFLGQTSGS